MEVRLDPDGVSELETSFAYRSAIGSLLYVAREVDQTYVMRYQYYQDTWTDLQNYMWQW